jgi:hypothetical protein
MIVSGNASVGCCAFSEGQSLLREAAREPKVVGDQSPELAAAPEASSATQFRFERLDCAAEDDSIVVT